MGGWPRPPGHHLPAPGDHQLTADGTDLGAFPSERMQPVSGMFAPGSAAHGKQGWFPSSCPPADIG